MAILSASELTVCVTRSTISPAHMDTQGVVNYMQHPRISEHDKTTKLLTQGACLELIVGKMDMG